MPSSYFASSSLILLLRWYILMTRSTRAMLYPRESETRQVKSLDGLWDFRADILRSGFEEMWYSMPLAQSGDVLSMPVPSSYNDVTEERWLRDFIGWVWYDKQFYVPPSWLANNKRVVLRFDNVFYRCKVWLNNIEVLQHEGGDLPFEVEITKELNRIRRDSHRVTVAVNNTFPFIEQGVRHSARDQRSTINSSFCDSLDDYSTIVDFAGIHGSVKLYSTPTVHTSDITYSSHYNYHKATVKFITQVEVDYRAKKNDVIMRYELLDQEGKVAAFTMGVKMLTCEMTVFYPKLWWPVGMSDRPGYLYTLKVSASYKDIHDVYILPVGIRTVRVEDRKFLINNVPFYFKGFGKIQDGDIRGRGFDYAALIKDFNLMKWFGANSIRTTRHPPPEELLELADKHGIVVIDESPPVAPKEMFQNYISDHTINRHLDLMTELVMRDKNHPSVVMWSVANHRSDSSSEDFHFHLRRMIEFTREMDIQRRPVTYLISSDYRFGVVDDPALEFCDVISFSRHYGWYWFPGRPFLITEALEEDLRGLHEAFNKPILMAEYGSSAVIGRHKVDTMKKYFPVFDQLRNEFLVGEMTWTFADYDVLESFDLISANSKGLLSRQRQPKASAHVLRQRYQALEMDTHPRFTGDELLDILIRFKPHRGSEYPISFKHRLPALIREERVNTTIRKRSVDGA
ncbi:Beta-glucuronidase [Acropora cervicornis]|uniref:Beta-glucuronidase n=1 Tax=Acropora cervicornis TaxID=6130 RepID=A0AAD9VGU2_ACRCE|nr:Beta-glucuronidase [Acropora cervicornis]